MLKSVVKCQLKKTTRLNKKAPMETTTANLPFEKCPFGHYWYSDRKQYPPTSWMQMLLQHDSC